MSQTKPVPDTAGKTLSIRTFAGVIRTRGEDTRGLLAVIEHTLPPGRIAMPLHRHERETETTYVLEGTLHVQVGKRVFRAGPGACIVKPVGVDHTFWNEGDRPARFLEVISPGGLEAFYEELSSIVPDSGTIEIARVLEISERYGLVFDMGSLIDIMERHAVQLA